MPKHSLVCLISIASLAACNTFVYTPPSKALEVPVNEWIVGAPYDEVWSTLISEVSRDFFGIDNFEKESGLLTLSFTVTPYSRAIESGHLEYRFEDAFAPRATREDAIRWDGPYVDFLRVYRKATFSGKVNLVVRSIGPKRTTVAANVRYVIVEPNNTFSFNSGQRLEQSVLGSGDPENTIRVMQSSGYVEDKVFRALQGLPIE